MPYGYICRSTPIGQFACKHVVLCVCVCVSGAGAAAEAGPSGSDGDAQAGTRRLPSAPAAPAPAAPPAPAPLEASPLSPSSSEYTSQAVDETAARNLLSTIFKRIAENPTDRQQVSTCSRASL